LRTSGPDADGLRSAVVQVGGQELKVFSHPRLVAAGAENQTGVDHFCFLVEGTSVADVIADLQQEGIDIVKGPERRRDGVALFLRDPDGVRVELQLKTSASRGPARWPCLPGIAKASSPPSPSSSRSRWPS
jgi:catechol 2,3-dioxygenase-like lactoylglutathione lyase family enzyme